MKKLKCWNCHQIFEIAETITMVNVPCPYCDAQVRNKDKPTIRQWTPAYQKTHTGQRNLGVL